MAIEAILFDMDGVLTDTEPVICAAAIAGLREYGVEASPEDFIPFVGTGEDSYIGGVARLHGKEYFPQMKKRVYEIYLEILPGMIQPICGVRKLLESLRAAGVPMAVATSADRIKMEASLAAIDIPLDWFGALVTGENVIHKKPDPEIYLTVAGKLGKEASNCCVVEDAVHGVEAAKKAGTRCVAVQSSFSHSELSDAGPDVICETIADITFANLGLT